jgi:hypothetical protein
MAAAAAAGMVKVKVKVPARNDLFRHLEIRRCGMINKLATHTGRFR